MLQRRTGYSRQAGDELPIDVTQVASLLSQRAMHRQVRDFNKADACLRSLSSMGVTVDDDQRTWFVYKRRGMPNRSYDGTTRRGDRREQSARHVREREQRKRKKASTPRATKRDRDAPYARSAQCTGTFSEERGLEIAEKVNARLSAKLAKRYAEADELLVQLGRSGVCVSDELGEWRCDGGTFSSAYVQTATPAAARHGEEGTTDKVEALVTARALAKAGRDYAVADRMLDQILDLGAVVQDRQRRWRYMHTGGTRLSPYDYRREQGHGGAASLELDPRLVDEVDVLLRERLVHKRSHRFELADDLESSLNALGVQIDEKRCVWSVAFAYTESSWRVRG
jgi:cysteinyl-tRNA synthetase